MCHIDDNYGVRANLFESTEMDGGFLKIFSFPNFLLPTFAWRLIGKYKC